MGHDSEKQSFKPGFEWVYRSVELSKSIFLQEKWDAAMRGKDGVVGPLHML